MEEPNVETLEETTVEEDLYHDQAKLMRVAGWANAVSWVILVLAAIFSLSGIVLQLQQGALSLGINGILGMISTLFILLVGGFFFVILQAIGEGIYLFMDIEEHLRRRG
ncbi:MAG: hypothetical protein RML93_13650 [Anaerolineales bacterium]|nr:hypothetical protein [Anaerolineales bacterium]MCS7248836.1 hypothetical protein [Anaerolineales bacterium]MDW8162649.1 hypothetical protein [Anaerolineales bacterium]MDW8448318.1 hypothetical protein [Anaerolineales bacterium]